MKRTIALAALASIAVASAAHADTKPSVYSSPVPQITCATGCVTQTNPVVYLVFWGPSWTPGDPEVQAEEATFQQIGSSPWLSTLAQYGVKSERYGGAYFDVNTPGTADKRSLAYEANRAAGALRVTPSPDADLIIFPQSGTNLSSFGNRCGQHDMGAGTVYAVIMPFQDAAYPNCTYDYSADDGTTLPDLTAADTAIATHEFAEMATDPRPGSGWAADGGSVEIADLCAWYSGTPQGMTQNATYVWSNATGGCVNPLGPPPTAAPPTGVTTPTPQPQPPIAMPRPDSMRLLTGRVLTRALTRRRHPHRHHHRAAHRHEHRIVLH